MDVKPAAARRAGGQACSHRRHRRHAPAPPVRRHLRRGDRRAVPDLQLRPVRRPPNHPQIPAAPGRTPRPPAPARPGEVRRPHHRWQARRALPLRPQRRAQPDGPWSRVPRRRESSRSTRSRSCPGLSAPCQASLTSRSTSSTPRGRADRHLTSRDCLPRASSPQPLWPVRCSNSWASRLDAQHIPDACAQTLPADRRVNQVRTTGEDGEATADPGRPTRVPCERADNSCRSVEHVRTRIDGHDSPYATGVRVMASSYSE